MKILQTGDTCPLCLQPIKTKDPRKLILLSAYAWSEELRKQQSMFDLCEDISDIEPPTNADKLRCLPDEELASCLMCPGEFCGGTDCKIRTGDGADEEPESCNMCVEAWIKAPYSRWEDEA